MKPLTLTILFVGSLSFARAQDTRQLIAPYPTDTLKMADTNQIFTIVQQMPKYPGDIYKFINDSLKYPEKERDNNITGTVYITFVVEKDGSVTGVRVLKGVPKGPGLDAESVRVVSMMKKWEPGMQNGKPVRVQYNIPIKFRLQ